jgi:hypothetical protein
MLLSFPAALAIDFFAHNTPLKCYLDNGAWQSNGIYEENFTQLADIYAVVQRSEKQDIRQEIVGEHNEGTVWIWTRFPLRSCDPDTGTGGHEIETYGFGSPPQPSVRYKIISSNRRDEANFTQALARRINARGRGL